MRSGRCVGPGGVFSQRQRAAETFQVPLQVGGGMRLVERLGARRLAEQGANGVDTLLVGRGQLPLVEARLGFRLVETETRYIGLQDGNVIGVLRFADGLCRGRGGGVLGDLLLQVDDLGAYLDDCIVDLLVGLAVRHVHAGLVLLVDLLLRHHAPQPLLQLEQLLQLLQDLGRAVLLGDDLRADQARLDRDA